MLKWHSHILILLSHLILDGLDSDSDSGDSDSASDSSESAGSSLDASDSGDSDSNGSGSSRRRVRIQDIADLQNLTDSQFSEIPPRK